MKITATDKKPYTAAGQELEKLIQERIVFFDGAMGTMIQTYELDEAAYRGDRFQDHGKDLKGNGDVLSISSVLEGIVILKDNPDYEPEETK